MTPYKRLLLKLQHLRNYLPYGHQSAMDECISIVLAMEQKHGAGDEKSA